MSNKSLAHGLDLVLDLESCQSLMVQDLADLSAVELEVRVSEVSESNTTNEKEQVRVITLALGLKWIIAQFITIWQIVNVVFFLPGVTMRVRCENVLVAIMGLYNSRNTY